MIRKYILVIYFNIVHFTNKAVWHPRLSYVPSSWSPSLTDQMLFERDEVLSRGGASGIANMLFERDPGPSGAVPPCDRAPYEGARGPSACPLLCNGV